MAKDSALIQIKVGDGRVGVVRQRPGFNATTTVWSDVLTRAEVDELIRLLKGERKNLV